MKYGMTICALFILSANVACANVVINEIMYDLEGTDTGREWIEIYNNTNTSVDLSTYKLFEANTNHALVVYEGNANISAGGYAIISSDPVKFKIDYSEVKRFGLNERQ